MIDCGSDLCSYKTPPPLVKKRERKKISWTLHGQGILLYQSPPPLLVPLSHQSHTAGQPISCSRGLKAPAGWATKGLLQSWKESAPSSLTLSSPFTVGRHYGSHYSGSPSCHRSVEALTRSHVCVLPRVCECVRIYRPCRKPSSPTECQMRRIKSNFSPLRVLTFSPHRRAMWYILHFCCRNFDMHGDTRVHTQSWHKG